MKLQASMAGWNAYLMRLCVASTAMNAAAMLLSGVFPNAPAPIVNNIFGTLFLSALFMHLAWEFEEEIHSGRPSRIFSAVGAAVMLIILGFVWSMFVFAYISTHSLPEASALAIYRLAPNILFIEGDPAFVALGAAFYALRKRQTAQVLALGLVTLYLTLQGYEYQWMMLAAAIPISLYSGERGNAPKWFFYLFYPAHIITLFLIRTANAPPPFPPLLE